MNYLNLILAASIIAGCTWGALRAVKLAKKWNDPHYYRYAFAQVGIMVAHTLYSIWAWK